MPSYASDYASFFWTVAISVIYYNCLLLHNQAKTESSGCFLIMTILTNTQMGYRGEMSFSEDRRGHMGLLSIMVWTRQKHSSHCYSQKENLILLFFSEEGKKKGGLPLCSVVEMAAESLFIFCPLMAVNRVEVSPLDSIKMYWYKVE